MRGFLKVNEQIGFIVGGIQPKGAINWQVGLQEIHRYRFKKKEERGYGKAKKNIFSCWLVTCE